MPLSLTGAILVVDDDSMRQSGVCSTQPASRPKPYASADALLADGRADFAACLVSDYKSPAMSGLERAKHGAAAPDTG